MPPIQRTPSLPGATQASKKAFKPPARVKSDSNVEASAPKTNGRASVVPSVPPKFSRANPNASRPTSAASSRSGSIAHTRKVATSNGKSAATSGFTRAGDLEDIEMTSSDEEMNAVFETMATAQVTKSASTTTTSANNNVANTNKRPRLARLPSLSDSSATPTRDPSPINVSDDDDGPGRSNEQENEVSNIGAESDEIPLLPAPLLTRLLHESFNDKQMKISKDANMLTARYLDIFVREAVARAALAQKERKESGQMAVDDDMGDDVWLDTRDLEEVAPGLVLDF